MHIRQLSHFQQYSNVPRISASQTSYPTHLSTSQLFTELRAVYLCSFITTDDDRLLVTQQEYQLPVVEVGADFNVAASIVSDYWWLIKVRVEVTDSLVNVRV